MIIDTTKISPLLKTWGIPIATIGLITSIIFSMRHLEKQAVPGSPYYESAVKIAAEGLANLGEKNDGPAQETRPLLQKGLNPDDYTWCEQHKTYHQKNPPKAEILPTTEIPPLLAGKSPNDYNWCDNCKTFHKRKPKPAEAPPPTDIPDALRAWLSK